MIRKKLLCWLLMILIISSFPVFSAAVTEMSDPEGSSSSWADEIPDMEKEKNITEGSAVAAICTKDGTAGALPEIGKGIQTEPLMELSESSGTEMDRAVLTKVYSKSLSTGELLRKLAERSDVVFAEPDYRITVQEPDRSLPDDAVGPDGMLMAESDSLLMAGDETKDYSEFQYAFNGEYGIGVPGWNTYDDAGRPSPAQDASGQIVAVMDSGVDYNHEDLADSMWADGENYPELLALGGGKYGYNACHLRKDGSSYDPADPMDDLSHGTHCAGIIAAEWNHKGVSGAASGAKIMPVKVMNNQGWGEGSEFIAGFEYVITAMKAGVPVRAVNRSWSEEIRGRAFDLAVREVGALGAVTVFAAGNEYRDIDTMNSFNNPLLHNPYALIVGNSTSDGEISESSCYGKKTVDLFAPGDSIFSTVITNDGKSDPDASPVHAGGITYNCGFEEQKVDDNTEDGVFGFHGDEISKTRISIAKEGYSSNSSLCMTSVDSFVVTSRTLTASEEMKGLTMKIKRTGIAPLSCMVAYYSEGGFSIGAEEGLLIGDREQWQTLLCRMPSIPAGDRFFITVSLTLFSEEQTTADILVDDIKLVGQTLSYDFMTGTSMAAPAVTASAAVLAAAFPEDDAGKRAARIRGSVKPVEQLKDSCTSGGIFRLDKALKEDTAPVPVSLATEENTVTVNGYFFGNDAGELKIDNQTCKVISWSETEVKAQLPDHLSGGDAPVILVSADGKSGLEYLTYGNAPSLMKRLPLPGRSVSGDPGVYEITSHEFDDTFYSSRPVALVGADNCLYYFMNRNDRTGYIFCYDIEKQTWSKLYESSELIPTGGVCTWNHKLLFIAGSISPEHASTSLCSYDLLSRELTSSEYNSRALEYRCALLNTGNGIILGGGSTHVYGEPRFMSVEKIRTVDPEQMTVQTLETDDSIRMYSDDYAVAWDENSTGYAWSSNYNSCSLFRFEKKEDGFSVTLSYPDLFQKEDFFINQDYSLAGGPVQGGIMLHGPVEINDSLQVTTDTYLISSDGSGYTPLNSCASLSVIYNPRAIAYRGHFYTIGVTNSENGGWVFCETEADTIPQPGDPDPAETPDYNHCPKNYTCPITMFTDSDKQEWYHDGVHWALQNAVMNGTGDTTFDPLTASSRAMIVTMLWRMEGSPQADGMTSFTDVPDGQWYTGAVQWANANGIVNGYSEELFGTADNVTREQIVTILYRYAQLKGIDVSRGETVNLDGYTDSENISEWAVKAFRWAVGDGIIQGMSDTILSPGTDAARAQVATLLMRFHNLHFND